LKSAPRAEAIGVECGTGNAKDCGHAGMTPNAKALRTRPRTDERERSEKRGPWPGSATARG
jgi:hypothetical protein